MLRRGTGPSHGTDANYLTPAPWHMARMIQSFDAFPVNLGIFRKGNAASPAAGAECELREDQGRRPGRNCQRGLGHHAGRDRQCHSASTDVTTIVQDSMIHSIR